MASPSGSSATIASSSVSEKLDLDRGHQDTWAQEEGRALGRCDTLVHSRVQSRIRKSYTIFRSAYRRYAARERVKGLV